MCGIVGALDLSKTRSYDDLMRITNAMGDSLYHRGPDEGGAWADADAGIALAHRRLSIQDLSEAGRQPMVSASGRYVLSYNGEVYNFRDLRVLLEAGGAVFRGHSDTEVLLEGLSQWGVEKTLSRLIGMFAFALWDRQDRTLVLARDRLGIKPLYWGRQGYHIFFTSELKGLFAHPDFHPEVDRCALSDLVAFNYVCGSRSIYSGITHLEPGCFVRMDASGKAQTICYWGLLDVAQRGRENRLELSDQDAIAHLNDLLDDAVRKRMIADVPFGAFLSGGVDSSLVTAVMQSISSSPVKTFTIGFGEDEFNEAGHARVIANHLGTEHHELQVSSREALDVIPNLSRMYCEPFADSSQIPTYLVSAMARRHVTVALSGDGGDEVFAGYNRHLVGHDLWPRIQGIPEPLRGLMARLLKCVPHAAYDDMAKIVPENRRPSQLGDKVYKVAGLLEGRDLDDFYARVVRFWDDAGSIVIGGGDNLSWSEKADGVSVIPDPVERMQAMDMLTYLPGDILTKIDRASMAVGLEARVPLLDHRVVEFAWSLPMNMKIRGGETKWLLRRVLDQYVPKNLIERPKMGFAVPLGDWLRGPLRDWAEDLLSEDALNRCGLFYSTPVRAKWRRHLAEQHHEQYALWSILMAQDWHRTWMTSAKRG